MTRLVLIDKASQTYRVYENKVCLATFIVDGQSEPPSKEDIEEIRVAAYPEKA